MTLGSALVLITFILLAAAGVYFVSKNKKWRLMGKIVGVIILLAIAISLGAWGWHQYQNRPQVVTGIGDVSLGMTPLEVTLAIGKPDINNEGSGNDSDLRYVYLNYSHEVDYFVRFSNKTIEPRAVVVCSSNYLREALGLGKYDSESDVTKKLGEPTTISVREDGLRKMISYQQWKVAFEIEQGDVESVCATESGEVTYIDEHESIKDNRAQ